MIILLGCTLINPEIRSCVTFKVVLSSTEFKYFSFTTLLCWQRTIASQWSQHMNTACDDIWKACFIYKHSCRQMKADRCKAGVASSPQAFSGCTFSSVSKTGSFFLEWKHSVTSVHQLLCCLLWALRCKMADIVQNLTQSQISKCWELPECLECESPGDNTKCKLWAYVASLINTAWWRSAVGVYGKDAQIYLRVSFTLIFHLSNKRIWGRMKKKFHLCSKVCECIIF